MLEMEGEIRLYRGAVAINRKDALRRGLNLCNISSKPNSVCETPPGRFFKNGNSGIAPSHSEKWADDCAEKEGKSPVVISLNITPANFHILIGRINNVKIKQIDGKKSYDYTPINKFSDLNRANDEITVGLDGLSHEELLDLGVKVGFKGEGGDYEYRPYKEWTDALGIRARSRKELRILKGYDMSFVLLP